MKIEKRKRRGEGGKMEVLGRETVKEEDGGGREEGGCKHCYECGNCVLGFEIEREEVGDASDSIVIGVGERNVIKNEEINRCHHLFLLHRLSIL